MNNDLKIEWDRYLYYMIIAFVSLISCMFLPLLGSSIGFGTSLPSTVAGWMLWVFSKLSSAVINILIFFCFTQQAQINVKKNQAYIDARKLLQEIDTKKEVIPEDPHKWLKKQYFKKVIMIFITSALSTIVIGQAILTFDFVACISNTFTMTFGIIFGILNMKKTERVFTEDYLEYAQYTVAKMEREEKARQEQTEKAEKERLEREKEQARTNTRGEKNNALNGDFKPLDKFIKGEKLTYGI